MYEFLKMFVFLKGVIRMEKYFFYKVSLKFVILNLKIYFRFIRIVFVLCFFVERWGRVFEVRFWGGG